VVTFNRRLPRFAYVKPASLGEALDLLQDKEKGRVQVYAGGTDVIPRLKARLIPPPEFLLDLKGIPELDYIAYDKDKGLRIGALATIAAVMNHAAVQGSFGILAQGAHSIASTQIQNRGTIAGNICNAIPSADSVPALFCLGAKLICVSSRGERSIGIEDFFTGLRQTVLGPGELLKEIQIPDMPAGGRGVYIKLGTRSRMDLAVVGVGVVVAVSDGLFRDVRIGLGSAAPKPIRAPRAEAALRGQKVGEQAIAEAGRIAAEESSPRSSHRASAEYRRLMVEVLVKRALGQALKAEE